MKKSIIILSGAVLAVVLLLPEAHAWRSVRTGQKNFERAWSAYLFKRQDRADEYFARAADAFGQALTENPPSRTTMFPSNLVQAGMSMYYAGRYDQAVNAMDKAIFKDDSLWEPFIYTAVSQARKGDSREALRFLQRYLKTNPNQPILSDEARRQIEGLQGKSASLEDVVMAMEGALLQQFINNLNFRGRNPSSVGGLCEGAFWWRNNRAPCARNSIVD